MLKTMVRGAMAGAAATVPMTVVIGIGRAAGLLHTPPPAEIMRNAADRAGIEPQPHTAPFQASWLAAHVAYGASCGSIFAATRSLLPRSDVVAGLVFGTAVWGASYLGVLPALDLFPSAKDDSPPRQQVMIAAHAVFGIATAAIDRRLRRSAIEAPD